MKKQKLIANFSSFKDLYKSFCNGDRLSPQALNEARDELLDMSSVTQDVGGNNFLLWLVAHHPEDVSAFITVYNKVIDLNFQNVNGWTALMMAARNSAKDGMEDIVKYLIDVGANVDLQNVNGWMPIEEILALLVAKDFAPGGKGMKKSCERLKNTIK